MKLKLASLCCMICLICVCVSYFDSLNFIKAKSNYISYKTENDNSIYFNSQKDIQIGSVLLKTPIVFSEYRFDDSYPGLKGRSLVLEMTNGSYDTQMGYFQSIVQGDFRFRLTKSYKDTYYEILDSDIISGPIELSFNEQFDLAVEDYDNDGQPDFAINQWDSLSGGTDCYIFSVNENGVVEKMTVKSDNGYNSTLWLPKEYRGCYSPELMMENDNSFSVTFYTSGGVMSEDIPLIPDSVIDDWFAEHEDYTVSELTIKNLYVCRGGTIALEEQQILEADGRVWYTSGETVE